MPGLRNSLLKNRSCKAIVHLGIGGHLPGGEAKDLWGGLVRLAGHWGQTVHRTVHFGETRWLH